MKQAQHEAVDSGFIDLNNLDAGDYQAIDLSDIENTLVNIADAYDLPIIQAFNALAYLKSEQSYQKYLNK